MPRAVPFVGRSAELDALAARFDEGARLVTLLGPGGIGKTALAVEHALRRLAFGGRTSSVFCDLSGARDAGGIVDAMAIACGAEAGGSEDAVGRVGAAMAARGEVLVVIDNFDGLAEHALETVGAWLTAAPEVEVLVTSRDRLGVVGEVVFEIGGLGAGVGDAVGLLVAAARRVGGAFSLREQDRVCAGEIVALLEGVPLALEIAGARLPLLGAPALLERLRTDGSLRRDARGGPARHATLDAAVKGSFDALAPHEREVLAELTVFRGGFTIASVEAIVEMATAEHSLLDVIEVLRSRSLVRTRDAAAARFDLYASVRSYVARFHPGPIAAAVERHASWFVTMAEAAAEQAHRDAAARAWLLAERDNLLAVVARVLGDGPVTARSAEPALRALVALNPVLLARGELSSVAALVAPVVERTRDSGADPRLAARALLLRGAMRRERAEMRAALKDLLAAESIARALGDELLGADVRVELGRTLLMAGELASATEHFDRASRLFSGLGARSREAHALAWLAVATATSNLPAARALLERAVALAAGDHGSRSPYLVLLGRACADAGDLAAAKRALDEAIASAALDADARTEATARLLLGVVLHDEGDLAAARSTLAAARDLFAVHGLDVGAAQARGHLGLLAREEGHPAESYALLADAIDITKRANHPYATYFQSELLAPAPAPAPAPALALLTGWPLSATSLHARVARRAPAPAPSLAPNDVLLIGASGTWFRAPSAARVGLERRPSLALLLDRLARERIARPGATLTSAALFAAAWPGEKAIATAAAHRVRVAVATLRKMGLRDAIVTLPDGYVVPAELRVVRA